MKPVKKDMLNSLIRKLKKRILNIRSQYKKGDDYANGVILGMKEAIYEVNELKRANDKIKLNKTVAYGMMNDFLSDIPLSISESEYSIQRDIETSSNDDGTPYKIKGYFVWVNKNEKK